MTHNSYLGLSVSIKSYPCFFYKHKKQLESWIFLRGSQPAIQKFHTGHLHGEGGGPSQRYCWWFRNLPNQRFYVVDHNILQRDFSHPRWLFRVLLKPSTVLTGWPLDHFVTTFPPSWRDGDLAPSPKNHLSFMKKGHRNGWLLGMNVGDGNSVPQFLVGITLLGN